MIQNNYSDVSAGIGCFKGTFSLQIQDEVKAYKVPARHVGHCTTRTIQKGTKEATRSTDISTNKGR